MKKAMLASVAVAGTTLGSFLRFHPPSEVPCWETRTGQEIYRLVVMDVFARRESLPHTLWPFSLLPALRLSPTPTIVPIADQMLPQSASTSWYCWALQPPVSLETPCSLNSTSPATCWPSLTVKYVALDRAWPGQCGKQVRWS
jgi:hypothetical protein